MIIPSFTGFAATPNTAQAYLGGVAASQRDRQIGLEEQQMAQQAVAANQAIQFKQQQLQAEQQQAAVKAQIEREQLEKQTFIGEQRINIEQQYNEQRSTIEMAKAQEAQQSLQLKTLEAARKFEAQDQYRTFIEGGGDASEGMRRFGPGMGMNGSAMSGSVRAQATMPDIKATPVPGAEGFASVPTRAGQVQLIDLRKGEQAQQRIENQEANAANRSNISKAAALRKIHDDDRIGSIAALKAARGVKMTDNEKQKAREYGDRAATIERLVGVDKSQAPESADSEEVLKYKDGKPYGYYDKKTGRPIRLYDK